MEDENKDSDGPTPKKPRKIGNSSSTLHFARIIHIHIKEQAMAWRVHGMQQMM